MTGEQSNDNDRVGTAGRRSSPDPSGQAALLLVESLLHGLIARSVLDLEDAIEIVDVAMDVKEDIALEVGDTPGTLVESLTILSGIAASLKSETLNRTS